MIRAPLWGVYWRARAVLRLYAQASWRERSALTAYAALELAARIPVLRDRVPRAAWIRLGGYDVLVALGRYELAGYLDVSLRRLYERVTDFRSHSGWTVVDVGANVGFFSLRQARLGARVIALEPNPEARDRFASTLERNGLTDRVRLLQLAAGHAEGQAELAVGAATLTGTLLPTAAARDRFAVEVRPLDALLSDIGRIDLLKIDVEGAEVDVLAGAAETLRRTERIVLEWHSTALREKAREILAQAGATLVASHGSIDHYRRRSGRGEAEIRSS